MNKKRNNIFYMKSSWKWEKEKKKEGKLRNFKIKQIKIKDPTKMNNRKRQWTKT